jgi:hypothetical protein
MPLTIASLAKGMVVPSVTPVDVSSAQGVDVVMRASLIKLQTMESV